VGGNVATLRAPAPLFGANAAIVPIRKFCGTEVQSSARCSPGRSFCDSKSAVCCQLVPHIRKINPLKSNIRLGWTLLAVTTLLCFESRAGAVVGATTPFTSLEAENGTLGGGASVVYLTNPPTTQFSSPVLEASGHA
jgi:hypothetical protein